MKCQKTAIALLTLLFLQIILCVNTYSLECRELKPLILMYHRISDKHQSNAFTITPALFENDIKTLVSLGYRFCTADELHKAIKENRTEKVVAITFDDGYKSDVEVAVPILKKYNACATFFIIGSKVGTEEYVTEDDIRTMSESGVAQIGNHSYDYHEKTYDEVKSLYSESNYVILDDIKNNQNYLKTITGKEITAYSYPYGIYEKNIDSKLRNMGIITFCSDEVVVSHAYTAYGRFNRPFDIPLHIIIDKINTDNKNVLKITSLQIANEVISDIKCQ